MAKARAKGLASLKPERTTFDDEAIRKYVCKGRWVLCCHVCVRACTSLMCYRAYNCACQCISNVLSGIFLTQRQSRRVAAPCLFLTVRRMACAKLQIPGLFSRVASLACGLSLWICRCSLQLFTTVVGSLLMWCDASRCSLTCRKALQRTAPQSSQRNGMQCDAVPCVDVHCSGWPPYILARTKISVPSNEVESNVMRCKAGIVMPCDEPLVPPLLCCREEIRKERERRKEEEVQQLRRNMAMGMVSCQRFPGMPRGEARLLDTASWCPLAESLSWLGGNTVFLRHLRGVPVGKGGRYF